LARVLGDTALRAQMREQGVLQSQHFSWEKSARQTLQVYREICG